MYSLKDKKVLITGGTGSLGKKLVRRLLNDKENLPKKIIVFSRDEAKQHYMRMDYMRKTSATDEIIYQLANDILEFRIGDVRDYGSISSALCGVDVVFSAAALKQVPACEYFPYQAVMTNINGPENIVRAIEQLNFPVETVIGISTDKACKPVNVMGMTKAIQERVFIQANMRVTNTRFICARYGNVLASRGSVIPLFHEQIKNGGPITITSPKMTRFLLSLNKAVDTILTAYKEGEAGDTYIPRVPSANIIDVAKGLIEDRDIKVEITGIRPGEKLHEILISEEELRRSIIRDNYYVIQSILPDVNHTIGQPIDLKEEYSSATNLMEMSEVKRLLIKNDLLFRGNSKEEIDGELLR
ncbi:MAG: polysaccharide biosynthesis protein [Anaerolineaceae bacterium]|nr:polysaccharide biosynthesis protein [Anaerolineaceae bacterium]